MIPKLLFTIGTFFSWKAISSITLEIFLPLLSQETTDSADCASYIIGVLAMTHSRDSWSLDDCLCPSNRWTAEPCSVQGRGSRGNACKWVVAMWPA
jgi:hypothetical protein